MAEKGGRPENLRVPTSEEARRIGRKGGIASGKARNEKKRMSQVWGDILRKKHKIKIGDDTIEMTGHDVMEHVFCKLAEQPSQNIVSLFKEIRQATEGDKVTVEEKNDLSQYSIEELEEMEKQIQAEIDEARDKKTDIRKDDTTETD